MGIWDTLIGLAATALREKPRQDVILALLNLRESMVVCQKTYDDYQKMVKDGDYDLLMDQRREMVAPPEAVRMYDPRDCWQECLPRLAEAMCDADPILTIFGPDADAHLHFYVATEAQFDMTASSSIDDVFRQAGAGIELTRADALGLKFRIALTKLDSFVRENFKPEEVFAARKRIKVWPWPFEFCGEYWLSLPR
jgi:hypothetical protein